MKQAPSIGTDVPKDREDVDRNGISDLAEEEFSEASEVQPQPADAVPDGPAPSSPRRSG